MGGIQIICVLEFLIPLCSRKNDWIIIHGKEVIPYSSERLALHSKIEFQKEDKNQKGERP
jgi:hypothetical protein